MALLVLGEQDMRAALDMRGAIAACVDALVAYSSQGADIPLRANVDVAEHGGQALFMPG